MTYGLVYIILGMLTALIMAQTTNRMIRERSPKYSAKDRLTAFDCAVVTVIWPVIWYLTYKEARKPE
jgi:hypothetical protein